MEGTHLRPHPTEVSESKNLEIKRAFSKRCPKYTYALNPHSYVDFEIFNIHKHSTIDRSRVGKLLATSKKPVVFFLCYDVGFFPEVDTFIRHVVCCVGFPGGRVVCFDMRNLADISKHHQKTIEHELSERAGIPIHIVNAACLSKCTYLQRFKDKYEIGWCIAWALFFLDMAVTSPLKNGVFLADMTPAEQDRNLDSMYKLVDSMLMETRTNRLIEEWYVQIFSTF